MDNTLFAKSLSVYRTYLKMYNVLMRHGSELKINVTTKIRPFSDTEMQGSLKMQGLSEYTCIHLSGSVAIHWLPHCFKSHSSIEIHGSISS